jgi:hypothetical protein
VAVLKMDDGAGAPVVKVGVEVGGLAAEAPACSEGSAPVADPVEQCVASRECGRCAYWAAPVADKGAAVPKEAPCRRRSPVPMPVEKNFRVFDFRAVWPVTKPTDWCGDFEALA